MKQKSFIPALALLGTTLLPVIAQAQITEPETETATMPAPTDDAVMASDRKMTGMMDESLVTSDADKQSMLETAQGSVYDRATAELAVQKAQSKDVQRYALRLLDDHNRLNKMLLIQANKRGLVLSGSMSDDDNTKLQILMDAAAGDAFDVAYLKEAMEINAEDVRTANQAINASTDGQFRGLMNDFVATEQKHLDEASKVLAQLQREMGTMNQGIMNK